MHLKSLTLKGFKSFAEPTTLDLEPGVTVVVGPNGSGKSNVVDAVAWVLGAQGPRVVRSARMDDVIFAGTAQRPALGRAEVSLVIDNSSHELPLDFNEVTLTRTLFRSGDSEYAINGASCRLLDVQELLSDSGVGRSQHVIIGQGQIDAILSARPEERRAVIEEAAGILKYRRRRERAVRRLEASEAGLTRLQDLLREVRRQMRPLERQAASAHLHAELGGELAAIRRYLAGVELRTLERASGEAVERGSALERRTAELALELERIEGDLQRASDSLARAPDEDLSSQLTGLDRRHERARGLLVLIEERRRSNAALLAALEAGDELVTLAESRQRAITELDEIERGVIELAPQWESLAGAEAALIESEVAHAERFSGLSRLAVPELASRRAAAERARSTVASLREGEFVARSRAAELSERLARRRARAGELARHKEELDEKARLSEGDAQAARRAMEEAFAERRAAEEGLSAALEERHRAQSRAEALDLALAESRERADLERLGALPGLLGTLRELITVEAAAAPALEAALLGELDAAVLGDLAEFPLAIERLAGHGGGLLALPRRPVADGALQAPPGPGRWLRELVDAENEQVRMLLDALLRGVLFTELPAHAAFELVAHHPDLVAVTSGGDRVAVNGIRLSASSVGATVAAHRDALAAEREAGVAVAHAEETLREALTSDDASRRVEAARREASDSLRAELAGLVREIDALGGDRDDLEAELEAAVLVAKRAAAEVLPAEQALAVLTDELEASERSGAAAAARYAEADEARHLLDERARALAALRRELEVSAAGLEGRRELLLQRRSELDEALASREEALREGAARRAAQQADDLAMARLAAELGGLAEELSARAQVVGLERDRRRAVGRAHLERLGNLRAERDRVERLVREVGEERQRVKITIAESRVRHEGVVEALRRDLEIEPAEALAAPRPELAQGVEPAARARTLERELRELGQVNPLAAEELASLAERNSFLEGQLEDVRRARRDLNQVIRAVDEEIVDVFAAAYEEVVANFEVLFATLFPGGEGSLSLTAPDDLLESGVEIEARPAGRNVRRLSLLSGGERSLVAMAYLFAVFRARPSPFYLMDEVEAALDEVNLTRFHGLVNEFRDEAQLIIVSHQKKTMEVADCLYGISMQQGGASRVISERVDAPRRYERPLEPMGVRR